MRVTKSTIDFILLILILGAGLVGFYSFNHQPTWQLLVISLTAGGYVIWGVWHHVRQGSFYWQVLLEYLLIAALVIVLTASLLL